LSKVDNIYVNIEIVFLDFLKNDFLVLRGLWIGWQYCSMQYQNCFILQNIIVVSQFCFTKILLYQQNYLIVSFFLIRLGCRNIWNNV